MIQLESIEHDYIRILKSQYKGSFTLNNGNGNDIIAVQWVAWYAMKVFTLGGWQRQWQWHRHGMGWIPICDGNSNGNPFDCMHFAIAIAVDTPPM